MEPGKEGGEGKMFESATELFTKHPTVITFQETEGACVFAAFQAILVLQKQIPLPFRVMKISKADVLLPRS